MIGWILANHGPHERWDNPSFVVGALIAVVVGAVLMVLAGRRAGWTVPHRAELGVGAVLATLPAVTLVSRSVHVALATLIGATLLAAPLTIAALRRSFHLDHRARVAWWVVVGLDIALLLWVEFGTGDWDNTNDWSASYAVYVSVAVGLVVGLWTLAWLVGWGATGTRPALRFGRDDDAPLFEPALESSRRLSSDPVKHTTETIVHAHRVRVLAFIALVTGAAMIPTFFLAVPGIAVMVVALLVLRATLVPTRTAGPWPHWAPAVLFGAAALALACTIWLVIWVSTADMSNWSALLALAAMAWTVTFCTAVVASRHEVFRDR